MLKNPQGISQSHKTSNIGCKKKDYVVKSERRIASKECKGSLSNTITTIKGENTDKDQSVTINKFGSVFTDSDKKISRRNQEDHEKKSGFASSNDKSYQNSSDEKIQMRKVEAQGTVQLEFIGTYWS